MKKFAAHYLLIPEIGYIKHFVIEVDSNGMCCTISPLNVEIENVEWYPGVIALVDHSLLINKEIKGSTSKKEVDPLISFNLDLFTCDKIDNYEILNNALKEAGKLYIPYLLYPFDFNLMQPVAETLHRQLL